MAPDDGVNKFLYLTFHLYNTRQYRSRYVLDALLPYTFPSKKNHLKQVLI